MRIGFDDKHLQAGAGQCIAGNRAYRSAAGNDDIMIEHQRALNIAATFDTETSLAAIGSSFLNAVPFAGCRNSLATGLTPPAGAASPPSAI
jgi:hypothetical protein